MSFSSMHDDYLDPDRHLWPAEEPIALHDDGTLKGHGRRGHGLCGKDADLDETGQIKIDEAWWFSDGHIEVSFHRYASVCPPLCCQSNQNDQCWEVAQEMVSGSSLAGEWSDDYWVLTDWNHKEGCLPSDGKSLRFDVEWHDQETDEENIARAAGEAYEAIMRDSEAFQREVTELNQALEELGKDHEAEIQKARLERKLRKARAR